MSQFDQSHTPPNVVVNIVGENIYLEDVSNQMIETIKRMGAFQMAFGAKLVWLIECADEDKLVKTLQELNQLGFLFVGAPAGYPAADMFAFLLERKKLRAKFKEIRSRGPGDWFIIDR
jgi:hypothetical protein